MEQNLPQYRRLYEILRRNIISGMYPEGSLLPSENDLCRIHNITRPTVRQALTALVSDGYIKKQKGKGSIVNALPKNIGILSIQSTTSAVGDQNLKTKIIVKPEIRPWPEDFIFPVDDDIKALGCIYFERLRFLNNDPIFYDISYMPNINMPRFTTLKLEDRSLFDVLRSNYQVEIKGGEQNLKAIIADNNISNFLKIKPGSPVLNLERKIETNRVGYHFYSIIYCNTSKYALTGIF
ncbi:GntR family transcriptional regulator [Saccharicrinis sp. FJH2]|uniref:GntR family transcriptional regulator n=1 Tax=Saccharicrinis sp. FJH65 TaxID=3344659 RepID=UPI0035F38E4D